MDNPLDPLGLEQIKSPFEGRPGFDPEDPLGMGRETVEPSYKEAFTTGLKGGLAEAARMFEIPVRGAMQLTGEEAAYRRREPPGTPLYPSEIIEPSPEAAERTAQLGIPGQLVAGVGQLPGMAIKYGTLARVLGPAAGILKTAGLFGGVRAAQEAVAGKPIPEIGIQALEEGILGGIFGAMEPIKSRLARSAILSGTFAGQAAVETYRQTGDINESLKAGIAPAIMGAGLGILHPKPRVPRPIPEEWQGPIYEQWQGPMQPPSGGGPRGPQYPIPYRMPRGYYEGPFEDMWFNEATRTWEMRPTPGGGLGWENLGPEYGPPPPPPRGPGWMEEGRTQPPPPWPPALRRPVPMRPMGPGQWRTIGPEEATPGAPAGTVVWDEGTTGVRGFPTPTVTRPEVPPELPYPPVVFRPGGEELPRPPVSTIPEKVRPPEEIAGSRAEMTKDVVTKILDTALELGGRISVNLIRRVANTGMGRALRLLSGLKEIGYTQIDPKTGQLILTDKVPTPASRLRYVDEIRSMREWLDYNPEQELELGNPGEVGSPNFDIRVWMTEHGGIKTTKNLRTRETESPGLDMTPFRKTEGAKGAGKYWPFKRPNSGEGQSFDALFQELQAEGYSGTIDDAAAELQSAMTQKKEVAPTGWHGIHLGTLKGVIDRALKGQKLSPDDQAVWEEVKKEARASFKDKVHRLRLERKKALAEQLRDVNQPDPIDELTKEYEEEIMGFREELLDDETETWTPDLVERAIEEVNRRVANAQVPIDYEEIKRLILGKLSRDIEKGNQLRALSPVARRQLLLPGQKIGIPFPSEKIPGGRAGGPLFEGLPPEQVGLFEKRGGAPAPRAKQPWEMTYNELLEAVRPGNKEELELARPILQELYADKLEDPTDPWGIYRAVKYGDELPRTPTVDLSKRHRLSIQRALSEGKVVPPEVLAEYPDIKPGPAAPAAPAPEIKVPGGPTITGPDTFTSDALQFVKQDYISPDAEDTNLYHVTTAKDKVLAEGLKARKDTKTQGLGGGIDNQAADKVSVTFDAGHAQNIADTLTLAVRAARNEIGPTEVLDRFLQKANLTDDTPEEIARILKAPEELYEDWDAFDAWLEKEYKGQSYELLQELDDALPQIFQDAEYPSGRVGLTADKKQLAKIDPAQIDIIQVEAKRRARPDHIADEMELRFKPEDIRIIKPEVPATPEKPSAPELSPTKKDQFKLPGMKIGVEFGEGKAPEGPEEKPPLLAAAEKAEKEKAQGKFEFLPDEKGPKDCYRNAARLAARLEGDYVEGQVTNPVTNEVIDHAWVEKDGQVYDPTIDLVQNKEDYYKSLSAIPSGTMAGQEALLKAVKERAFGPFFKTPKVEYQPPKALKPEQYFSDAGIDKEAIAKYEAAWKAWVASIPEEQPVVFQTDNMVYVITRDTLDRNQWRASSFSRSDHMPWGHEIYATKEEALREHRYYERIPDVPFEVEPLPMRPPEVEGLTFIGIQKIPGQPDQYAFNEASTGSTFYTTNIDPKFLEAERDRVKGNAPPPGEPVIKPDQLSRDLAERAHNGTSWTPEKRAEGEQKAYVAEMTAVWDRLKTLAKTDEDRAIALEEFERYQKEWLKQYAEVLASRSRLVSAAIAGPSKFPSAQMEKRNNWYEKKVGAFLEWDKKVQAAMFKKVAHVQPKAISADREDAIPALQQKIDAAKAHQTLMKAANIIVRMKIPDEEKVTRLQTLHLSETVARKLLKPDFAGRIGFPNYELQNNLANIKRMEDRVVGLTREKARPADTATFEGGRIEENEELNRIQIFFDQKPGPEMIKTLKANGFHWSPKEGAWQRQKNENTRNAIQRIFKVRLGEEKKVPVEEVPIAYEEPIEFRMPEYKEDAIKPSVKGEPTETEILERTAQIQRENPEMDDATAIEQARRELMPTVDDERQRNITSAQAGDKKAEERILPAKVKEIWEMTWDEYRDPAIGGTWGKFKDAIEMAARNGMPVSEENLEKLSGTVLKELGAKGKTVAAMAKDLAQKLNPSVKPGVPGMLDEIIKGRSHVDLSPRVQKLYHDQGRMDADAGKPFSPKDDWGIEAVEIYKAGYEGKAIEQRFTFRPSDKVKVTLPDGKEFKGTVADIDVDGKIRVGSSDGNMVEATPDQVSFDPYIENGLIRTSLVDGEPIYGSGPGTHTNDLVERFGALPDNKTIERGYIIASEWDPKDPRKGFVTEAEGAKYIREKVKDTTEPEPPPIDPKDPKAFKKFVESKGVEWPPKGAQREALKAEFDKATGQESPKIGRAYVREKGREGWRVFTDSEEITRGKHKGKVRVTLTDGRKVIVDKDSIKFQGEGEFRLGERPEEPLSREAVEGFAREKLKQYKNAPEIEIIEQADIPDRLLRNLQENLRKAIKGIYDPLNKKIYLIRDMMADEQDVLSTIEHEAVSHFGLESILGPDGDKFFNRVYMKYGKEGLRGIAEERGFDLNTNSGRLKAAKEMLGQLSENGKNPGLLKQFYAWVREQVRKIFPNMKLADAEIQMMLKRARDFLRSDEESKWKQNVENFKAVVRSDAEPLFSIKTEAAKVGKAGYEEEVKPKVEAIKSMWKYIKNGLAPTRGVDVKDLNAMSRWLGDQERAMARLEIDAEKHLKEVNKLTRDQQIDFIDAIQNDNIDNLPANLKEIAEFFRKVEDDLWTSANLVLAHLDEPDRIAYLDNHVRNFWKVVPRGALDEIQRKGFTGIWRRPIQGTRAPLFSQAWTLKEGMANGGIPKTTNLIEILQLNYQDTMKLITARRMWDTLLETGHRVFGKWGEQRPEGFVTIDDPIAKRYFPRKFNEADLKRQALSDPDPMKRLEAANLMNRYAQAGLPKEYQAGQWYVEENAARLLQNYVSKDLVRGNPFLRGLMAIKNMTTALELGFSAFHASFITWEAIASQLELGMRRIWNQGMINQGLKDIMEAPTSFIGTYKIGSDILRYFRDPEAFAKTTQGQKFLQRFPDAADAINHLFWGGGSIRMNEAYKISSLNVFKENLNSKNYIGAAFRSIPALSQWVMKPLFENYIPAIKRAVFLKEFSNEMLARQADIAAGKITKAEIARDIWHFVENRFGEMNFDNLWWNRTMKSGFQLAIRSVTWKYGNVRGYGKALTGQVDEIYRAMRDHRRPMLTREMAWVWGLGIVTAAMASVAQYMFTGKPPEGWRDLVYPQIDNQGGRISLPTYMRDIFHMGHAPVKYVTSSMAGYIGRFLDVLNNKDFYGVQVHDPNEGKIFQMMDDAVHMMPLPFSVTSLKRMREEGEGPFKQTLGFFGGTKAPYWIERTSAEMKAGELKAAHLPVGGRTPADFQRGRLLKQYTRQYQEAQLRNEPTEPIMNALHGEIQNGKLYLSDLLRFRERIRHEPLVSSVEHLPFKDVLEVWKVGNAEERKKLYPVLMRKFVALRNMEDRIQYFPKIQEIKAQNRVGL